MMRSRSRQFGPAKEYGDDAVLGNLFQGQWACQYGVSGQQ